MELGHGCIDGGTEDDPIWGYVVLVGINKDVFAHMQKTQLAVYDRSTFTNDRIREQKEEGHYEWVIDEDHIIMPPSSSDE